jgi:hypothetical protein
MILTTTMTWMIGIRDSVSLQLFLKSIYNHDHAPGLCYAFRQHLKSGLPIMPSVHGNCHQSRPAHLHR